jgi:hypothetical protein
MSSNFDGLEGMPSFHGISESILPSHDDPNELIATNLLNSNDAISNLDHV